MTIWELDFYSRPLLDDNGKKLWEVLICEAPQTITPTEAEPFRYSQLCPNTSVNSIVLREAIETAIAQAGNSPKKIRFFRRQMNNMISKACEDAGITAAPSRRTYRLEQWLDDRLANYYPHQDNYDPQAAKNASVQYPAATPIALPDAIRGNKGDRWALVTLEAQAFSEMGEWDIDFGEAFPLDPWAIAPDTKIPGLLIFSPRATPLAAWMSGLELCFLRYGHPQLILETGANESWIVANLTDKNLATEAQNFETTKQAAQGIHFLAVQTDPESDRFAGLWLLKE